MQARYEEAIPHVPGTGMVKPRVDLGHIDVELKLSLHQPATPLNAIGVLGAYAMALREGDTVDDDEGAIEADMSQSSTSSKRSSVTGAPKRASIIGSSKPEGGGGGGEKAGKVSFNPRIIRQHVNRLKRCFGTPYVLAFPFSYALLATWYLVCFHLPPQLWPPCVFVLLLWNGLLGYRNRADRTKDMIFWEESVGDSDMPKGLTLIYKIVDVLGLIQGKFGSIATAIEKQQNMFNFADPPISFVAYVLLGVGCAILSAILWLVPLSLLSFGAGAGSLAPFLTPGKPKGGKADAASDKPSAVPRKGLKLPILPSLVNIFARIPDGKDEAHLLFCRQQKLIELELDRASTT